MFYILKTNKGSISVEADNNKDAIKEVGNFIMATGLELKSLKTERGGKILCLES